MVRDPVFNKKVERQSLASKKRSRISGLGATTKAWSRVFELCSVKEMQMAKIELFTFVGLYSNGLDTLANILEKGRLFADVEGVQHSTMLEWRLAPDMFPLRRQAQIVCTFAAQWPARAAGLDVPEAIKGESTIEDLLAAVTKVKSDLRRLTPDQLQQRDLVPLTFSIGELEPTMPIGRWLSGFATTNFYFHLSMAYAILRANGVPLGKRDMFAAGL
jgi:hypothetical protein